MFIDRTNASVTNPWQDPQACSDLYLKKKPPQAEAVQMSLHESSIASLEPIDEASKTMPVSVPLKQKTNSGVVAWLKNKWHSFLEFIGIKKPVVQAIEREHARRVKIRENHSTLDSKDDFKYLDIATIDPLKVMLAILVKQGELREEQALLIKQKILLVQEDMKDLHDERTQIHAELALVGKRAGVIEKVSVGVTVGQVITGIVSTATVVASAATIATGGAATPLLVVTGALQGVLYGAQAFNTWLRGNTKQKMNKLQGEMLSRNATRDELQFQLKIDVKDMRKILGALASHAEIGSALLSAQRGK